MRGAALLALAAGVCAACSPASDRPIPVGEPVTLADAGASNPTVAVGLGGVIHVAWTGVDESEPAVYSARVGADGVPLGEPVRVNDRAGDAAPHGQAPARVVAAGDTVWVVWPNAMAVEGRRFPASDLRMARSTDGGQSFEPTTTVNDDAGQVPATHTFHDALVTPRGELVVSWLDSRTRWQEVAREAGWRPGDPPPGDAEADDVHHHGSVDEGPEVRIAVSRDGGITFAPSSVVEAGSCPCCRTQLATGPDGALFVAWRKVFEGNVRDVVVARSDDLGRSWGEPVRVHADEWVLDGCPHAGPGLVAGADGTLHVSWYTGKEGGTGLFYAASSDGGATFSAPVRLTREGFAPPSQARLAVLPDGEALVAWEDRDESGEPVVRLAGISAAGPGEARSWPGTLPDLVSGPPSALAWLDGESVRLVVVGSR